MNQQRTKYRKPIAAERKNRALEVMCPGPKYPNRKSLILSPEINARDNDGETALDQAT